MKKTSVSLAVAFVVLAILSAGCAQQAAAPTQEIPTQVSSSSAVTIQGFAFSPQTLTIKAGTTVTWTNNDTAAHTVVSSSFTSEQLGKGQTYEYTFSQPGTFDYHCSIHPSMTGQIIVQ